METIVATKYGSLVHLGFPNQAGGTTDIVAIHEDNFADLFGLSAYRKLKEGTLRLTVETEEAA